MDSDRARRAALVTAAVAQAAVPTLGPRLAGTREGAEDYDTVVTPPGYAFAIWAPIFAASLATAAGRPDSSALRRAGWPLAGAYTMNTAWSLAAQSGRFGLTPAILPASAGLAAVAYRRLQGEPAESVATLGAGLLLGWTALASVVNVSAGTQLLGADPRSRASVALSAAGAAGVAAAVAAAVVRSRRGWAGLAAAAAWGLGTTALTARRPAAVRAVTGAAAAAILAAAAFQA